MKEENREKKRQHTYNRYKQRHSRLKQFCRITQKQVYKTSRQTCLLSHLHTQTKTVIMSMIVNDYYDQWSWWRLAKHKHSPLYNMVDWKWFYEWMPWRAIKIRWALQSSSSSSNSRSTILTLAYMAWRKQKRSFRCDSPEWIVLVCALFDLTHSSGVFKKNKKSQWNMGNNNNAQLFHC